MLGQALGLSPDDTFTQQLLRVALTATFSKPVDIALADVGFPVPGAGAGVGASAGASAGLASAASVGAPMVCRLCLVPLQCEIAGCGSLDCTLDVWTDRW